MLVWLVVALLDGLVVGVVGVVGVVVAVLVGVVVVKPHVANDVSRNAANAFVTMPMVYTNLARPSTAHTL